MTTKFTIITGDTEDTFTVKPKHILKSEQEDADLSPVEATYRLAWRASGSAEPFEDWIDGVDDIIPILPDDDEDKKDEETVPPTTAGSRRSRSTRG